MNTSPYAPANHHPYIKPPKKSNKWWQQNTFTGAAICWSEKWTGRGRKKEFRLWKERKKCQAVLTETKYLEASFLWKHRLKNPTPKLVYIIRSESFPSDLFSFPIKIVYFLFLISGRLFSKLPDSIYNKKQSFTLKFLAYRIFLRTPEFHFSLSVWRLHFLFLINHSWRHFLSLFSMFVSSSAIFSKLKLTGSSVFYILSRSFFLSVKSEQGKNLI